MFMRFPGGRAKAVTLSYDDAPFTDKRLVSILAPHGMRCTFNVNSAAYPKTPPVAQEGKWIHLMKEEAQALYHESCNEVATHGLTHQTLTQLDTAGMCHEILTDRINHEEDYGCIIRGHAYPNGSYDDQVINCLRLCGIVYARTVESTGAFGLPADWFRWHPTAHHRHPRLPELCDTFLSAETKRKNPLLFYLWGHSWEFDRNDNWQVIEDFAAKMGSKDDIWYATNIEIHDYTEAYRSLITSVKRDRVYNPTATDVWLEQWSGRIVCVKAGEELSL